MNKQMSMSFVQDELAEVKTNKTALLEPMSLNEYDESNRPIRLTENTTDGTLLRQTRLSYSAAEHPFHYNAADRADEPDDVAGRMDHQD